jgi:hypothetical protein
VSNSSGTSFVNVFAASPSITLDVAGKVLMSFTCTANMTVNADFGYFMFMVDGAVYPAESTYGDGYQQGFAQNDLIPITLYEEVSLSAGSHTFNVGFGAGGTGTLVLGTGGTAISLVLEAVVK